MTFFNKLFAFLCFPWVLVSCGPSYTLKDRIKGTVFIRGTIEKIDRSDNHSFGIYFVKKDTSYVDLLEKYDPRILPFSIQANTAEIYGTVGYFDSVGHIITLSSSTNLITITNRKGDTISSGYASLVDGDNENFVEENSLLQHKR